MFGAFRNTLLGSISSIIVTPPPVNTLPKWTSALLATRAGTARTVIGVIGDSIPAGAYSGTPNTSAYQTDTRSGSWPYQLQKKFQTDLGLPDAGKNIFGNNSASAGGTTQADMLAANSELLFSGTNWNQYSSVKNLGGWVFSNSSVNNDEVGFNNSDTYDTVEVFFPTNSTLTGTLLPRIGGVQVGSIATNLAPSVISQKFTGTAGAGGVRIRRGGSSRAYFAGMVAYKAADKSIAVYNAGWAGSQTSDWTNNPTGLDAFDGVGALGAASNLVLIYLGTNDINNSIAQATFLANMNALYNKAKTVNNDVLFIIPHYMNSTLKSFAIQDGYWNAFKAQCNANGQKFFDCKTITGFSTWAASVAAGYMGDANVHLSAAGSIAQANGIYKYLMDVAGQQLPVPVSVPVPAGLGWTPEFGIFDLSGQSYTNFSMAAVKPVADYIYYCSPTGSASASPASNDPATPITPRRLVTLANAHGGTIQAYIAGGQYYGNIGFDGNNITCAGLILERWVGQGTGRAVFIKRNTNQAIPVQPATNAWYADQGTTYYTTHVTGGTSGVWDLFNKDAKGAYSRLTYAADLATCRTTPGTCWWDGLTTAGKMYVNPIDGRSLIGDTSTMIVTTNSRVFLYNRAGNATCWIGDDIDFIGGTAFQIQTAGTTGKFYASKCAFYGGDGSSTGSLSMLGNIDCRLIQCTFGGGVEDSFNIHGNTTGDVRALTDRCHGFLSGFTATGANNTSTQHENCKMIEVAPDHYGSQNRTVHHIQNSKAFMVRPSIKASKATDTTSVTVCAGVSAGQTTEIWIWGLGSGGIQNSVQGGFAAYSGSAIRYANGDFSGITIAPGSAGIIGSYTP